MKRHPERENLAMNKPIGVYEAMAPKRLDYRRIYKLRPGISGGQTINTKGKSVMQSKSRIKNFSLAVLIGCAALFSLSAASAQQEIAPTATLEVAPATVVDAQPNFVMEQPPPPREIPFRPTMNRSDYHAAKARANFWGPRAARPFTPLATPVIKTFNFDGHSSTEGLRPAAHMARWVPLILSK